MGDGSYTAEVGFDGLLTVFDRVVFFPEYSSTGWELNPEDWAVVDVSLLRMDDPKPDKAKCKKAVKILEQVIRLSEKYGVNLGEKRKRELLEKIEKGTIRMEDVPAKIRKSEGYPENEVPYKSMTLEELRKWCGMPKPATPQDPPTPEVAPCDCS